MNVRNMNQEEKVSYMLSEPVPHLVCQMAVPTIILPTRRNCRYFHFIVIYTIINIIVDIFILL